MKAGGNRKARVFLESQDDWDDRAPISQKYQSRYYLHSALCSRNFQNVKLRLDFAEIR